MIRLLIIDDHPAVRAGLIAVLRSEPGFVPVGAVGDEREGWVVASRTEPDVILLDLHLPEGDSLAFCRRIKAALPATRVMIYSAFADQLLGVAAALAAADGLLDKTAPMLELFDAIRRVHKGEPALPPITAAELADVRALLPTADWPIVALLLDGASEQEIAETLALGKEAVGGRVKRILARLAPSASRSRV